MTGSAYNIHIVFFHIYRHHACGLSRIDSKANTVFFCDITDFFNRKNNAEHIGSAHTNNQPCFGLYKPLKIAGALIEIEIKIGNIKSDFSLFLKI